ncbi:hypothetical protein Dsin_022922 [Dipteronia sinensis]|uniref:Bifunctional inhibitor/plant lipid transfer protein/seed storage helical domain-containing protein n=1 Tax=Dipteronia sinensis TaxID=43782 RepID=A0AAE0A3D6_9ROSI|nr:hypothetical protein Dsin_022922 [Dipteronia sinensis]
MAKFTLLVATFALFLLVANATIYRTTVVIDDADSRSGQQQRCQRQLQDQQELNRCKSFLSQRIQGHGANPRQQQDIQQCCQQLEQLDRECRCPGLEQVTRSQVSQGQLGDQQKRQIIQTAQRIPSMCGMRPTQCDFETLTTDNRPRNTDQQRCQQQFQEQQQLRQCKSYLSQRVQEEQPYGSNRRQEQEIQQCCQQLEQLDRECRCPGLEQVTRSQVSQGQLGDQQKRQIIQTAQRIPSMCGMRPTQCDFETLTTDNSPRNTDQQRCQQQLQEQQQLSQCKSYLSQRVQEEQPYGSNRRQEQEIQPCCRQLEQLDTECRCPGLERVTRSQVSQSQLGDQQKRQIIQIAESIPSMCNMRPMECDFESSRSDM